MKVNLKVLSTIIGTTLLFLTHLPAHSQAAISGSEWMKSYLQCCDQEVDKIFNKRGITSLTGYRSHRDELRSLVDAANDEASGRLGKALAELVGPPELKTELLSYHEALIDYIEFSADTSYSGPPYHAERSRRKGALNSKRQVINVLLPSAEFRASEASEP